VRPYWKGYLKLALVFCPIALHAACSTAAAQRLHQVDDAMGRGEGLLALGNGAGLLSPEVRKQRLFVAIPEGRGIERAGLGPREYARPAPAYQAQWQTVLRTS
jgi:hypothetical protein